MGWFRRIKDVIESSADGFAVLRGGQQLFRLRWDDVREIVSFKRDLITADCVCLAFRTLQDDKYFEINEEIEGFVTLSDAMIQQFPSIPPDWFATTTQPPFAATWTRLYGEQSVD